MTESIYDVRVKSLEGEETTLRTHAGKVLLIVNTASQCRFTPQLGGLEKLYAKHADRGFVVLGFPCNQFLEQEPGDNAEIGAFCQRNYGVTFPMHSKVDVSGPRAHPLFVHLTRAKPGLMGTRRIKWNFTKFLVDREGRVAERYGPTTRPSTVEPDIETLLALGGR